MISTKTFRFLRMDTRVGLILAASTALALGQPMNDTFANATRISGTNVVATGNNIGATKQAGEPNHAGNSGGCSVWWVWTAPKSDSVTVSTKGSDFDTLLAVYTGSTLTSLTAIGGNDDEDNEAGILTSKLVFSVTAGQTYRIAVDGWGGDYGMIKLQLLVGPPPPPPPAPSWALPDPWGNTVRSTDFAGKVVMVNFWGTTCGFCLQEMPDMVALQAKYRADGFEIVGADISWWNDTPLDVVNFLNTFTPTINYQIVMSTPENEAAYGEILGVPTSFIIDRQNRIRRTFVGAQTGTTFERSILPCLYETTPLVGDRTRPDQLTLRWPANTASFSLESTTSLQNPNWLPWPTLPSVVNGSNTVVVPSSGVRFFRLNMPY